MLTVPEGRAPPPSRGLVDTPWIRRSVARLVWLYIQLTRATNKVTRFPEDRTERLARFAELKPAILVSWHANILAIPFFIEDGMGDFVGLSSPHADGLLGADLTEMFGFRSIIGTGASERQTHGTGGMAALRSMLRELQAGRSVYMTAEVPPTPGRRVSMGVIALARMSGRPIVAIAAASSRRSVIERLWDKMQINHPFGRMVLMADGPLYVDDRITNDAARDRLKILLDGAYAEALRRADEGP